MARVNEAIVVLFLVSIVVSGLVYLANAVISGDETSKQTLFDVWTYHLPYMYSCISFIGVLILLLCTPLGVARMFSVMGQLIVKPQFLRDIEEELSTLRFEEGNLLRKVQHRNGPPTISNGYGNLEELMQKLDETRHDRIELEKRQHISFWRRNLCYPFVMLLLFVITVISILIVLHNTFSLLVGLKVLPKKASNIVIGIKSLSSFGPIGAAIQIIVILYLMAASVVGFYCLPYLRHLQPRLGDTPMVKVISNCGVILILSSALPVFSKTLGITNFDLVGNFGSMDWLGNFYIIFACNIAFAAFTSACLGQKFTYTVRREIASQTQAVWQRLKSYLHIVRKPSSVLPLNNLGSLNGSGLSNLNTSNLSGLNSSMNNGSVNNGSVNGVYISHRVINNGYKEE